MFPHIRPEFFLWKELRHEVVDFVDLLAMFFGVKWNVVDFRGFRQVIVRLTAAKCLCVEIDHTIFETKEFRSRVNLVDKVLVVELFTHLTHNIILEAGRLEFGADVHDTKRLFTRIGILVGSGV